MSKARTLMSTLKFLNVFSIPVPSIDELQPEHTVIQIIITKHIGTETRAYGKIVRSLIIQGKANISDIEFVSCINAVYF